MAHKDENTEELILRNYNNDRISLKDLFQFLKPYEGIQLWRIWKKLPTEVRRSEDMKTKLPCYQHFNLPTQVLHIDGSPPPINKCNICSAMCENCKKLMLSTVIDDF